MRHANVARRSLTPVTRVLGVDACKTGWVGIVLDRATTTAMYARTIAELVSTAEATGALAVVGIDIPIGLPDAGRRRADVEARKLVGPRWASVFIAPARRALLAENHPS